MCELIGIVVLVFQFLLASIVGKLYVQSVGHVKSCCVSSVQRNYRPMVQIAQAKKPQIKIFVLRKSDYKNARYCMPFELIAFNVFLFLQLKIWNMFLFFDLL